MTRAEWLELECLYLAQAADEIMSAAKGTNAWMVAKERLQTLRFCEIPEGPFTRNFKRRIELECPK